MTEDVIWVRDDGRGVSIFPMTSLVPLAEGSVISIPPETAKERGIPTHSWRVFDTEVFAKGFPLRASSMDFYVHPADQKGGTGKHESI